MLYIVILSTFEDKTSDKSRDDFDIPSNYNNEIVRYFFSTSIFISCEVSDAIHKFALSN